MLHLFPLRLALALTLLTTAAAFALRPGETAPNFTGTDSTGQTHTLDAYRGKYVVLEWHNHGCPYTMKHYDSGNMQALQKKWTAKGVIWFTVISSAPGKQGYVTPTEENAYMKKMHAVPTAAILDPSGKIGRMYEARTTPDMYIIDPQGKLIYEGAIDDHPTSDPADIKIAKNYVDEALTAAMSGKPIAEAVTRPYGCSVKYGKLDQ
ncbi:MAG: redoxin domain-containing protein [Acidobacteriaceae bacterium]